MMFLAKMNRNCATRWFALGLAGLLLAGLLVLVSCDGGGGGGADAGKGAAVASRDTKGVWFITDDLGAAADRSAAGSRVDTPKAVAGLYNVFKSMGYLVAQDRLWQMETYRRTARGTMAEIFGSTYITSDTIVRTVGYTDAEYQAAFDAMDPEIQDVISGYVAGVNQRIEDVLANDNALLPYEFKDMRFVPAPWTVIDVLAWVVTLQRNFDPEGIGSLNRPVQLENAILYEHLVSTYGTDGAAMFDDLRWINDPTALTYIPGQSAPPPVEETSQVLEAAIDSETLRDLIEQVKEKGKALEESIEKINAKVKMGSYAWTVSGNKTASGNPIIYSGPQMGFETPSIVVEGSIRAGGLNVSGMTVPGIPGIIIGRTPHHAWSMQVGHAHTVDFYLENLTDIIHTRTETIQVRGQSPVVVDVGRTARGPILSTSGDNIVTWKYSHWNYELNGIKAFLDIARAESMDEFGAAIEEVAVSQHYCYADRDGNIAYWMSGRNPLRPGGKWRFPQGFEYGTKLDWDPEVLYPRSTDRNNPQGFYGGWNNKSNPMYDNCYNNPSYFLGPFHRAHVVDEYLRSNDNLTFDQVRDLALNIATTDSFGNGGVPWQFVADTFIPIVQNNPTDDRTAAITLLQSWDGHFVEGGESQWVWGDKKADAWVLMDAWLKEVVRLTFQDKLSPYYEYEKTHVLFNVLLRGLDGRNLYDWYDPSNLDTIVLNALDNVLVELGSRPWEVDRGVIKYHHIFVPATLATTPYACRSTYAHVVEYGPDGPVRIESMFPLGESGDIQWDGSNAEPDPNFLSMLPEFNAFAPRDFPLFD